MADERLLPGETLTANYGWTKPDVGGSGDAWGGEINADLDGIDSVVHGIQTSIPAASSTAPAMDGTAAVGTGTTFARADHVHPTDTSRYAATNPSGYQTSTQVTAALAPYAPLASPALTGVPTAPTAAPGTNSTQIATTAFVEALPVAMNDNRIINGDMRIDQRNNGASGTAIGVYTLDRWLYNTAAAGKGTWSRMSGGTTLLAVGFGYYLYFVSSSAYTSAAGDQFRFSQPVEADQIADFAWGTASAQPVTLSFWASSTLTGTFAGAIRNYTGTRSYPFTYSIPTAGPWYKIVLTIPGDTTGTWVLQGNGGALYVDFDLGCGSSSRAPAGAWASGNYMGATGAVSVVATNGASFSVTGVKLEIGSVATPFNRQSLAKSMVDCQRYYQISTIVNMNANSAGTVVSTSAPLMPMRATPTLAIPTNNSSNMGTLSLNPIDQSTWYAKLTVIASGAYVMSLIVNASAEL